MSKVKLSLAQLLHALHVQAQQLSIGLSMTLY